MINKKNFKYKTKPKQMSEIKTVTLTPSKVKPLAYASQSIIFPIVGEATFSERGTLEVPEDQSQALIDATVDSFGFYELVADGDTTKSKSKTQVISEEEGKIRAELDKLDSASLIQLAKDSGIEQGKLLTMTDGKIKKELIKILLTDVENG